MTDLFFYTHNSYLAAFFPHDLHIKNRELLKKKKILTIYITFLPPEIIHKVIWLFLSFSLSKCP